MKRYLPYLLLLGLVWGCKDNDMEHLETEQRNAFLGRTEIGVYQGGSSIALFQTDQHQIAYTDNGKSWRIQTDDQQQYLSCKLNEKAAVDKMLTANINAKGMEEVAEGTYTAIVLKITDGKCWLWLPDPAIGLLIQLNNK